MPATIHIPGPKIYLSSRYGRRDELRSYRAALQARGHTVTSSWLDETYQITDGQLAEHVPDRTMQELSIRDWNELQHAGIFVCFTEPPGVGGTGGRHVEYGIALRAGLRCIIVGPRENLFHHLPECPIYSNFPEMLNNCFAPLPDCKYLYVAGSKVPVAVGLPDHQ